MKMLWICSIIWTRLPRDLDGSWLKSGQSGSSRARSTHQRRGDHRWCSRTVDTGNDPLRLYVRPVSTHLKRYSSMDKTITVDQLATTDLSSINEIWLGGTHTQLCLWRGEQIVTHDMLSEGTHDQNARRLCLQLVNPDDQAAVASVEVIVRERLEGREGEFYPAEDVDTYQ